MKNQAFKLMAVVVCVFMLVTLFAGCNKMMLNKAEKSNEPKRRKTINFWFWNADEGNVFKVSRKSYWFEVKLTITTMTRAMYRIRTQLKVVTILQM